MRIFLTLLFFFFAVVLSACESEKITNEEINEKLYVMVSDKKSRLSSYIGQVIINNRDQYDDIVNSGRTGFDYLISELKNSSQDGLREWIIAMACSDILNNKNPVKEWSTGKEWLMKYEEQINE